VGEKIINEKKKSGCFFASKKKDKKGWVPLKNVKLLE